LIGLEKPSEGRILVNGEDIVPLRERQMNRVRRKFGMVFQYSALLDSMNVLDNVAFPLREHTKLSEKEIRARVLEKLAVLKLEGIEKRFPSQLSGGMRKRVGLARALMLEPEVLMYDEPTSGLDPLSSRMVDELIVETRERFGVTSIVISHDMAGAMRIANVVYLLSKGELVAGGTPEQLVSGSASLVQEFLHASGVDVQRLLTDQRA
jgi:phospholipid/cholesterol/gamma-HCH transport system ATP-binding protein